MFITAIETKFTPEILKVATKVEEKVSKAAKKTDEVKDLGNYYLRYDARNALIKSPKIEIKPSNYFAPSTPIIR